MDFIEYLIILLVFVILSFAGAVIYKSGMVKQELILTKTGTEVSWFTALNYPDNYFTDANVRVVR